MFSYSKNTSSSSENKFDNAAAKILKSELQVTISTVSGSQIIGINQLLIDAKKSGKAVVFTFTPGPFKSAEELPADWMNTPAAMGCTAQLTAFEKGIKELNAMIFAVNKQSNAYQCGATGLLAMKKFNNLLMISDENDSLEKELGLTTITVNGKQYIERFSIAIKPNGEARAFEISSPVNDAKASEHVAAITQFITPRLEKCEEDTMSMSATSSPINKK